MTSIAVPRGPMAWRLRIRNQSTISNPDGTADALVLSSLAGTGTVCISAEPSGDGAELDPLGGTTVTANYRVNVIDTATAAQTLAGIVPGAGVEGGVVTAQLGDTSGRSQLISRRAYLEQSLDGGSTWGVQLCAGYVNRLRLIEAGTYEFTIGETRRVEQTVPVFQTIAPGLDQGTCLMGGPIAWQQAPLQYFNIAGVVAPNWVPTQTYAPGKPVVWNGIVYVGVASSGNINQEPPNTAYWMPVVGKLQQGTTSWSSGPTFSQGSTVVASDGYTYVALVTNSGTQPVNDATGSWLQLGPTLSSTPSQQFVPALPWINTTSYVPGNTVSYNGIEYVCISGNTNDPPPDVVHWTAIPTGAPVDGVWSRTVAYSAGVIVVGGDGNAYLAIQANTNENPVQDIQNVYWVPVAAIDFGTWGPIPDYGGMLCVVVATGKKSNTLKVNPLQGWAKVPNPKAGNPAWSYIGTSPSGGGFPSAYLALINQGVPALVQGYGPSPVGYGATYLQTLTGPRNGAAPFPVGLVDTFTDGTTPQLGWIAGAIAIQVWTQNGQRGTTNCYTQVLQQSADNNRQWTQTPVLLSQGPNDPGTFYIDWHDFYQLSASGQPIAPVDRSGAAIPMPAIGSIIQVKAVAVPITSDWPLHISMHPVDLLTTLWTTLQIPYDVANIQAVRSALGDDLILLARVTGPMYTADVFQQWIGGPLGLGIRVSETAVQTQFAGVVAGAYQLVQTRQPPSALPTVAWTDNDCYGEPGHEQPIYDLDESTTCQQVSYSYQSYIPWSSNSSASRTGDDAIEIDNTMTFQSEDYAVYGTTTESYNIPGGYGSLAIQQAQTMSQYGQQWSNLIFERFSRGATQTTVNILASSQQANLGDLVLWESNRMPNPALNQRGGVRLCMVIKKTFHPQGCEYVLEDLGAAEQPAETPPTFTLALDTADEFHTVDITITNYGTLLTAYPSGSLQVQGIVQSSQPGSAQSGTVVFDMQLDMISSPTFPLPAVPMGSTVWYRANVRPGNGALPSVWTSWTDITTDAPSAISGLTATPAAGGTCLLSWTNPDTNLTTPIAIYLQAENLGAGATYSVILSSASFQVEAGDTFQLTAQTYNTQGVLQTGSTYNWDTSNHSIATVNSSGLVTAVSAGSVTVTATDSTAGRGSPVGESFATVEAAPAIQQVVLAETQVSFETSSAAFNIAVTVYDVNGDVVGSPSFSSPTSSNTSVATVAMSGNNLVVTPGADAGQTTLTVTCSGVHGTATGTAIAVYGNLAQAARASQHRFSTSVVQNYPNDAAAYVGGQINTSLGLPFLKTNYGTFTPGVVDGKLWPELVDINGCLSFGSTAVASCANIAAIASITTQMWVQIRVRTDAVLALPRSSGAGLFSIGTSPSANHKLEGYLQTGATAGAWQFVAASYETGGTRSAIVASGFSETLISGNWLNLIVGVDTTGAETLAVYCYDDNGTVYKTASTALTTALNTDGGVNGAVFLNQAFNASGPTQAMIYGGFAIASGTVQATPARWQPASATTPNIIALYFCADGTSGTQATVHHTYSGTDLTVTAGTVTGVYDNGTPYNWLLWNGNVLTSGPGGEVTDENQWKEFHFITGMTGPSNITFNYGMLGTIAKCRSLGIRSRAYLFQGSGGSAIPEYATYITSAATATAALNAIVNGIVGYMVQNYGTGQAGGIQVWNIANEFMYGGEWADSIWYQYLGSAWVADVAAMVYALDPSAYIMINLNNIELASDTAQQQAVAAVINAIHAKGVPMAQIILGNEFHLNNVHQFTAQDAAQYASFVLGLPAGCLIAPTECDITDLALPNTGASSRSARELLSNQTWQMLYGSTCLGASGVWARCYGTGSWGGKSSLTSWLNVEPPTGSSRTDGDFEEAGLTDENYNPFGGAFSDSDVYGTVLTFLSEQAAL